LRGPAGSRLMRVRRRHDRRLRTHKPDAYRAQSLEALDAAPRRR
jgi:hypothetical protein